MSLLHRITRLFKADMHGILDALEEPDIMLKQAVREMREEIEQSEAQLKTLTQQAERLALQLQDLSLTLLDLDGQVDFCFTENNETLVKTLLRKKLETRQIQQATENRRQTLLKVINATASELAERQDKLKSILDKMALFSEKKFDTSHTGCDSSSDALFGKAVTQEDVELAYLKEKQLRQAQREQRP